MAYREVTMIEIKEVLRLRVLGVAKKRIAAQLGLDPKTVRRYLEVGESHGIVAGAGPGQLTDERLGAVLAELKKPAPHEHGDAWWECERERPLIVDLLKKGVRLTKIRKLMQRQGVDVPYSTLHRFAVLQLGFGKRAATVPLADGEPGVELQVDPGSVGFYEPGPDGKRRKIKVIVFTPNVSRYRFVCPIERETTEEVIAAFEAAWTFYKGVYRAVLVDNLKAVVQCADRVEPRFTDAFLEYAQARGFVIDTARVRKPKDKARVERSVRDVRDDCFAGEHLRDIAAARVHAERWCRDDYGARRHSTTGRMPREHFLNVEAPVLLSAPEQPYDVSRWCTPKVARDHFVQVERALYSMPTRLIGPHTAGPGRPHHRPLLRPRPTHPDLRAPTAWSAPHRPERLPPGETSLRHARHRILAAAGRRARPEHRRLRPASTRRATAVDPHAHRLRRALAGQAPRRRCRRPLLRPRPGQRHAEPQTADDHGPA